VLNRRLYDDVVGTEKTGDGSRLYGGVDYFLYVEVFSVFEGAGSASEKPHLN
jgi:hypothetical protein